MVNAEEELEFGGTLPTLTAGVVIGVTEAVLAVSFAALIFSGPLAEHVPEAVGYILLGAAVILVIVGLFGSIRGTLASVQDIPAAILALVAAAIAAEMSPGSPATVLTVIVAVGFSSVLAGGFFLLLGAFGLGGFVRFVPFPVVGGFLAGTGWLLVVGGVEVLAEVPVGLATLPRLLGGDVLLRLAPGLVLAAALLVIGRRSSRPLAIPTVLALAIVAFHAVFAVSGATITEGAEAGWLVGPFPEGALLQTPAIASVGGTDWGVILGQLPSIGTLIVLSVLALLLNASGIELAVRRDGDLDRELRVSGLANLLAGAVGGLPGYHALSLTALAHRMWARTRLVGVIAGGVCVVVLLAGGTLLSLVPTFLLGGVLVFVGLGFLSEWLYDTWGRMPIGDYLVVVVIVVVMAAVGFLEGVGVGIAMAVVLFVVNYSRNDVVKNELSGAILRSRKDRPPAHREVLREAGEHILIMELQGYLFFGTANELLERIRRRVRDPDRGRVEYLLVDLRRVGDLDISSVMSFSKIHQLAEARGFTIVYTGLDERTRRRLEQGPLADAAEVTVLPDLDRGLEWCEEQLLADSGLVDVPTATELLPTVGAGRILDHLERVELAGGEVVIDQGERSNDVYFLESGQLTVELRSDDGQRLRLRTLMPGSVVGEASFYVDAPRTATVLCDRPSVLLRLTPAAMSEMEREDPATALELHRLLGGLLAARLADTLGTVNALLD